MEQVKPRRKMGLIALFIVLLLFFTAFRMGHHFVQSHFLYNTKIEGVSCSLLSIDEGIEQAAKVNHGKLYTVTCFSDKHKFLPKVVIIKPEDIKEVE